MLLNPGTTCWRVGTAPRAALLIDMADYFTAAKAAMLGARRSIHLLNWAFEADASLDPTPDGGARADRIGDFLKDLARDRPEVDVRVLCWRSALPVAATQGFFTLRDRGIFAGSGVRFVLDASLPFGACHHQKVLVVDDAVAFCGGGDFGPDRWDTPAHLDDDPRRRKRIGGLGYFASRHEVMGLVDGPPARALGELFRERWRRATGETLGAPAPGPTAVWPDIVTPQFREVRAGLSRTSAPWRDWPQAREVEALTLASIAAARRCIYLENQYFTSPIVAEALAAQLARADGPEVIIISTRRSPSWFDQMTMDRTRSNFIKRLKAADVHGRFLAYSPRTAEGRMIIVHAKLAIIDEDLLRIGSANMNNRSAGFDTECDLTYEAAGETAVATRTAIGALRSRLLAHWLGCAPAILDEAVAREGAIGPAIEALRRDHERLTPIEAKPLGPLAAFIAAFHLGDPLGPADSLRPLARRRLLAARVESLANDLTR